MDPNENQINSGRYSSYISPTTLSTVNTLNSLNPLNPVNSVNALLGKDNSFVETSSNPALNVKNMSSGKGIYVKTETGTGVAINSESGSSITAVNSSKLVTVMITNEGTGEGLNVKTKDGTAIDAESKSILNPTVEITNQSGTALKVDNPCGSLFPTAVFEKTEAVSCGCAPSSGCGGTIVQINNPCSNDGITGLKINTTGTGSTGVYITSPNNTVQLNTPINAIVATNAHEGNATMVVTNNVEGAPAAIFTGRVTMDPPLEVPSGGTGLSTVTQYDMLYAPNNNILDVIATAPNAVLQTDGTGLPGWSSSIAVTAGGTGLTSVNQNDLLYGAAPNVLGTITSSPNAVLQTDGTGLPGWSSSIAVTAGGTGLTSVNQNDLLYGAAPNVLGTITSSPNAVLQTNGSGVPNWSSSIAVTAGGTGLTSIPINSMLYASASNVLNTITPLANSILQSNGSSVPSWVATPLNVTSGGTGLSSIAQNSLLYASAANTLNTITPAANSILQSNGSSVPSWVATPLSVTSGGTGLASISQNSMLYASAANTLSTVAPTANGILQTNASSVPSWAVPQSYSPTVGGSSGANFTLNINQSNFIKIGSIYYVWAFFTWTSKNTASGELRVTLPATTTNPRSTFSLGYINNLTGTGTLTCGANQGVNYVNFYACPSGATPTVITVANASATGEIQFSGAFY